MSGRILGRPRVRLGWLFLVSGVSSLSGCGAAPAPVPVRPLVTPVAVAKTAQVPADGVSDVGAKPEIKAPPAFLPPTPQVFASAGGITVWLLERHQAPIVSCSLTVPTGASSDPKGKAGLAYATATMLDEGAGKRGAVELSSALDDLGVRLSTDANADASFVSMTVLKSNVEAAFPIFADVVTRPRFDAAEFGRVKDLWYNELLERQKDPDATARVVYRAVLFGPDHPYGHPWDGTPSSAKAISLNDVKRFYAATWRPDRAVLVCVGDVTKPELTSLLDRSFGPWKAPAGTPPTVVVPAEAKGPWPKLVLVDRAEAPQAVVAVLRPGLAASNPAMPAMWRVNDAIGGSFSSRLNQDLREAHGYTYGARSRYSMSRGPGQVVSWANVVTDKTGEALVALTEDLRTFASAGLTDDEVARTRSQARGELVGVYEAVETIAGHLAAGASLGLPPDFEAKTSQLRDSAQKAELDSLAKQFYAPEDAVLVVVGPRSRVEPMITKLGLPAPEIRDAEGNVIVAK